MLGDHVCRGFSSGRQCTVVLDKFHARCERHGVCVVRRDERLFVHDFDVKAGDRIVL